MPKKTCIISLLIVLALGGAYMGFRYYNQENSGQPDSDTPIVHFCGLSTEGPCESDADCVRGGCSDQACRSVEEDPLMTSCEWKDCYRAEDFGFTCQCIVGKCMWAKE